MLKEKSGNDELLTAIENLARICVKPKEKGKFVQEFSQNLIAKNPNILEIMHCQFPKYFEKLIQLARKNTHLSLVAKFNQLNLEKGNETKLSQEENDRIKTFFEDLMKRDDFKSELNSPSKKFINDKSNELKFLSDTDKLEILTNIIITKNNKSELILKKLLELLSKETVFKANILHLAAGHGHEQATKLLIEKLDQKQLDIKSSGKTPFDYALHFNHLNIAKILVKKLSSAQICQEDSEGYTLLISVILINNLSLVKEIIPKLSASQLHEKNKKGLTPLDVALDEKYFGIIQLLIESLSVEQLCEKNIKGYPPLHYMIIENIESGFQILVKKLCIKNRVHEKDSHGYPPLYYAIITNRIAMSRTLLDNISQDDLNGKYCQGGMTLLHIAISKQRSEIAEFLILKMSQKQLNEKMTAVFRSPLYLAINNSDTRIALILINKLNEEQLIERTPENCSMLDLAIAANNSIIVKALVEKLPHDQLFIKAYDRVYMPLQAALWADNAIFETLSEKCTPKELNGGLEEQPEVTILYMAIYLKNIEAVRVLVGRLTNCQLNEKQKKGGLTPFHVAINEGNSTIVKILAGGLSQEQINEKDDAGFTPLKKAVLFCLFEIVSFLLDRLNSTQINEEINGVNFSSAFHLAVFSGNISIVKLFLDSSKIDMDKISSALKYVIKVKKNTMISLLLRYHHPDEVLMQLPEELKTNNFALFQSVKGFEDLLINHHVDLFVKAVSRTEIFKTAIRKKSFFMETIMPTLSSEINSHQEKVFEKKFDFLADWNKLSELLKTCKKRKLYDPDLDFKKSQIEKTNRYSVNFLGDEKISNSKVSVFQSQHEDKDFHKNNYYRVNCEFFPPLYIYVSDKVIAKAEEYKVWNYNKLQLEKGLMFTESGNSERIGIKKIPSDTGVNIYEISNKADSDGIGGRRLFSTLAIRFEKILGKDIQILEMNGFAKDHTDLHKKIAQLRKETNGFTRK